MRRLPRGSRRCFTADRARPTPRHGVLSLRAERAGRHGKNNGRVYGTVEVSATDVWGNTGSRRISSSSCPGCPGAVCVPHDQNPKSPGQVHGNDPFGMCQAVDDGQFFDALVCQGRLGPGGRRRVGGPARPSTSETDIHELHLLLSRSRYLELLPRCQIDSVCVSGRGELVASP